MDSPKMTVRIKRGELNGELCNMFRDKLMHQMLALPGLPDPRYTAPDSESPRKKVLPDDSIFLYAEAGPESGSVPIGSISLLQIHFNTPHFKNLTAELDRVGELKRTIVFDDHQRMGVGTKLVEALERIAKDELGLKYLVVETLEVLGASRLYETCGRIAERHLLRIVDAAAYSWKSWRIMLASDSDCVKKVYEESIGIFCDANDITVELESSLVLNRRVWNMTQIYLNNILLSQCTFVEDVAIGKVCAKWPALLKHKKELQLVLRVDRRMNSSIRQHDRVSERMNHLVYSFCCFISESRSLRELDVTVRHIHRKIKPDEWARILWPLAKISQAVRIRFYELSHETDIRVRHHLKDTVAWPINTLALAREVVASASAAGIERDKNMSMQQKITSNVRNALHSTKAVDHVFDLELTATLKMISATHGIMSIV